MKLEGWNFAQPFFKKLKRPVKKNLLLETEQSIIVCISYYLISPLISSILMAQLLLR